MAEQRALVRDVMTREIVAVDTDATVAEAIAKMEQHRIHELPVMQNSSLKGWVNYDALIQRAHLPAQAKITSVMTSSPKISQSTDLVAAADTMIRNNVRAVAVVDAKGNLVGILSRTDIMRAAAEVPEIADQTLDKVMTRDLETIAEDANIDEAARRLRELSIRQLLVLDRKGKLIGTVGREVVMHALSSEDKVRTPNRAKGSPSGGGAVSKGSGYSGAGRTRGRSINVRGLVEDPLRLRPNQTLGEAIGLMLKGHKTSVVVEDGGLPVGVVARANVLERLSARAVRDGPLVQLIGIQDHVDGSVLDQIHAYARHALDKVGNEYRVEFLSLHYKVYKAKTEGDSKYAVSGHLSTEQKFLVAKGDDWDPIKATNVVLDELQRRANEAKEIRITKRKMQPRRKADFYTAAP
ncbi:MAG: CBS domain-containing protein [Euryarchaeota archaeon]|nr:CBS domain-containing protein [Euryarchaeota archaeon]